MALPSSSSGRRRLRSLAPIAFLIFRISPEYPSVYCRCARTSSSCACAASLCCARDRPPPTLIYTGCLQFRHRRPEYSRKVPISTPDTTLTARLCLSSPTVYYRRVIYDILDPSASRSIASSTCPPPVTKTKVRRLRRPLVPQKPCIDRRRSLIHAQCLILGTASALPLLRGAFAHYICCSPFAGPVD
jgi:hypothetical protein